MMPIVALCLVAALAAVGGLAASGLALAPMAGLGGAALIAAPMFGVLSLSTGLGAAVLVLRRQDRAI